MELAVQARTLTGKKVNTLRRENIIPAIVYGRHMKQPMTVQFDKNAFLKVYRAAGESTVVDLTGDNTELVLIHQISTNPVTDMLEHVDFLAVKADEKVQASVAISLEGVSPAEKDGLGRVELVKDHVLVEALPRDLPHDIKLDISGLKTLQDGIFVSDLQLGAKVTVLDDAEQPIVAIVALQDEAEETTTGDAAGAATAAALEAEKAKASK
jgi:large subunit ribosomal protein L25